MPAESKPENEPDQDTNSISGSTSPATAPPQDKTKKVRMEWSPDNEKILVEWCDVAQCYKWLNTKAHMRYSILHARFTIPAITLSTISGTASFAQTSLPIAYQVYAPMVIGTINIAIGILTTIQQYLKISELNEAHRVAAIAWDKYARNIRIELAKAPKERTEADVFIKHNRSEFDRLMETSPMIPADIIKEFMTTFQGSEKDKTKKERFEALKKPDICDIIISAEENRHHWYKEIHKGTDIENPPTSETTPLANLETRVENDILKREEELRKKEQEARSKEIELENREKKHAEEKRNQEAEEKRKQEAFEKHRLEQIRKEEARIKSQTHKIEEYVTLFNNTHGRRPLGDEISEHFKQTHMDQAIVAEYLQHYSNELVA